jgi:hypothetical protein
MISSGLQIVSRNEKPKSSAYELTDAERMEVKGLNDAYYLVMFLTNTPFISAQGLEIGVRVQAYLCREYNKILLKGWHLQ